MKVLFQYFFKNFSIFTNKKIGILLFIKKKKKKKKRKITVKKKKKKKKKKEKKIESVTKIIPLAVICSSSIICHTI